MDTKTLKERKASASFYGFEKTIEQLPNFAELKKLRPISELQDAAQHVWHAEGGKGPCYTIKAAPNGKYSNCWFASRTITLIPKHRFMGALLHEMAHALGTRDKLNHGPAFRARCVRFYRTYGNWDGLVDFSHGR